MEKRHKALFQQLEDYRQETLKAIEGLTKEDVNIIPDGFSNNILWNLGHIYLDQYLWITHLTKKTPPIPPGFNEWFNLGTKPADWDTQLPKLAVLVRTIFHEGMHLASLNTIRRCLGK